LSTDPESRAELELEGGSLVRMGEETQVLISKLESVDDDGQVTVIILDEGTIRARVAEWDGWVSFDVEVPNGVVSIREGSSVRIEVDRWERTRVYVFNGRAELIGTHADVAIRGGEYAYLDRKGDPTPAQSMTGYYRDQFDRWCEDLDEQYMECVSYHYLPPKATCVDAYLFDECGRWVVVADYGTVWCPRVAAGWRPYCHGHWTWTIGWGWTWVPYERWGWYPYHYGRWAWTIEFGWVWVPGTTWGPAWVAWSYGPGWVGWVPLDPWGRPWCARYHPDVFISVNFWTCVSEESFRGCHYRYRRPPADYNKDYHKPYKYHKPKIMDEDGWKQDPPKVLPSYVKDSVRDAGKSASRIAGDTKRSPSTTIDIKGKTARNVSETVRTSPQMNTSKIANDTKGPRSKPVSTRDRITRNESGSTKTSPQKNTSKIADDTKGPRSKPVSTRDRITRNESGSAKTSPQKNTSKIAGDTKSSRSEPVSTRDRITRNESGSTKTSPQKNTSKIAGDTKGPRSEPVSTRDRITRNESGSAKTSPQKNTSKIAGDTKSSRSEPVSIRDRTADTERSRSDPIERVPPSRKTTVNKPTRANSQSTSGPSSDREPEVKQVERYTPPTLQSTKERSENGTYSIQPERSRSDVKRPQRSSSPAKGGWKPLSD
jgi:hypothetical protein